MGPEGVQAAQRASHWRGGEVWKGCWTYSHAGMVVVQSQERVKQDGLMTWKDGGRKRQMLDQAKHGDASGVTVGRQSLFLLLRRRAPRSHG